MKKTLSVKIVLSLFMVICFASVAMGKTVTLSWDESPSSVAGYKIYYDTDSSAPLDGTGATEGSSPLLDVGNVLTYVVHGLEDGSDHYFAVSAYDSDGNESSYSNIVHSPPVSSDNAPPVFDAIGNQLVIEGDRLTFTVLATDDDGDSLSYSTGTLPSGAVFNSSARSFSWVPNSNQAGTYSVTFSATDGTDTVSETIQIVVTNSSSKTVTLSWDASPSSVAGYKIYYDTDSSSPLNGSGASEGSSPIDVGNVLTYVIHGLADDSEHFFAVTAYDGSNNESSYSNTVHSASVNSDNTPPVFDAIGNKSILEGGNLNFTVSASDADGDSLTLSVGSVPSGAGFNATTGVFSWTPNNDQSNTYAVTFSVSDGTDTVSETIQITVTDVPINHAPILTAISDKGVAEGDTQYIPISATDSDGDSLSFSFSGMPAGAVFNAVNNVFAWATSYSQEGSYPITVTVSDGNLTDSESFTITVSNTNRAPLLNLIGSKAVAENSALVFTVNGSDLDGDDVSYGASNLPTGAVFNSQSREFSWNPTYDQAGSYNVTFTASDGNLTTFEQVVISVSGVNRAPVLASVGAKETAEGSTLTFTVSGSDVDGDDLSYSANNLPDGATFNIQTHEFGWVINHEQAGSHTATFTVSDGSLTDSEQIVISVSGVNRAPVLDSIETKTVAEGAILSFSVSGSDPDGDSLSYSAETLPDGATFNNQTNEFVWNPTHEQAGSYTVTFTASDSVLSASASVTITVSGVNRAPVLSPIGSKAVAEEVSLQFSLSGSDPDSDSLSYSVTGMPPGASLDSTTGAFTWTPDLTQANTYSVVFSVSDGSASASETVQITVTDVPVNHAPTLATISNVVVAEGANLEIAIVANDPDSDPLTYSFSGLPAGAVFDATTSKLKWSPNYTSSKVYPVVFTISDGELADTKTFTVTVSDVNRAPVLNDVGVKTVAEGAELTFTILGSDADSDALSYSATDLPNGAVFNPVDRSFRWTPEFQATQNTIVHRVTFVVSDSVAEDIQLVTINVTNVNRPPVLVPIGAQQLVEGDSSNLVISASDPDSNTTLTLGASGLPVGAVFSTATNSFTWSPADNQAGIYQVTFSVSDGALSDTEEVTFTVGIGNKAPVLDTVGEQTIAEGSELTFVASASDVNGDILSYSATGIPAGASFDADSQQFSWLPDYTQAGDFTVHISVTDGILSDSETINIAVVNTNQPPVITGAPDTSVMVSTNYSFTPVGADQDGDTLNYTIINKPEWATFDTVTGELSGTPIEAQIGNNLDVIIGVSDAMTTVSLAPFSIAVVAYVHQDTDGDGVIDQLDAFPDDAGEWEDTDGDSIGNNSDLDDDNDGVADIRDGAPLDDTKSGWIISAMTGTGGYLTPEGDTSVLYGGSKIYTLATKAGYYINDLLVDNVSVGVVTSYNFENIGAHHTITAVFSPIPQGLSCDPAASGLVGIERVDGGDNRNNLVDDKPKLNLDYRLRVVLRDSVTADQRQVFVVLDGYKYALQVGAGDIDKGVDYTFTTRLGASFQHQYYFVAEDLSGNNVWRYPATGTIAGPEVKLLEGKNIVSLAASIDDIGMTSSAVFRDAEVYRWDTSTDVRGAFALITGTPIASGEGYVLKCCAGSTLADLSIYGEITLPVHEYLVKPGWNLIGNPYGGNIALADVEVRHGTDAPVVWSVAVTNSLVVDAVYSYLGEDWGDSNEFASADGIDPAVLIPWIGYWIYINPTDEDVSLIFTRPLAVGGE